MSYGALIAIILIGVLLLIGTILYLTLFTNTTVTTQCKADSDCSNGTICVNGACTTSPICKSDNDCSTSGAGNTCVGGRCVQTNCTADNQCPVGSICQSGQCSIATCKQSSDCPNSSYCVSGLCQSNSCVNSNQCNNGGCEQNICYQLEIPCSNNNDCFGGALICNGGVCQGNIAPSFCPQGWIGYQGFCYPITSDSLCPTNYRAVAGTCCPDEAPCGNVCSSNSDCGGACSNCLDGICRCLKAAVPETFPNYPFATCYDNSNCSSNRCLNNYCVPSTYTCTQNLDCNPFGNSFCVQGLCSLSQEGSFCLTEADVKSCHSSGRSCVNSICRVARGTLGEQCSSALDCQSGLVCSGSNSLISTCNYS